MANWGKSNFMRIMKGQEHDGKILGNLGYQFSIMNTKNFNKNQKYFYEIFEKF